MHNIFNINLTKFGQLNVKGESVFSLQVWGGVSFPQTLRERSVITPKKNNKRKGSNFEIENG